MTHSILDDAKEITGNDRMVEYGDPRDVFEDIAEVWNAHIKNTYKHKDKIDSKDVALLMILLKTTRELHNHKRDNIVDIAGYARNIAQIIGME